MKNDKISKELTDFEASVIDKLNQKFQESLILQTFVKVEVQRAKNDLDYKTIKKLVKMLKEGIDIEEYKSGI